jgi:hypothetical protein
VYLSAAVWVTAWLTSELNFLMCMSCFKLQLRLADCGINFPIHELKVSRKTTAHTPFYENDDKQTTATRPAISPLREADTKVRTVVLYSACQNGHTYRSTFAHCVYFGAISIVVYLCACVISVYRTVDNQYLIHVSVLA